MLARERVRRALSRALPRAGSRMPIKRAIMATTTSNSMRVKPDYRLVLNVMIMPALSLPPGLLTYLAYTLVVFLQAPISQDRNILQAPIQPAGHQVGCRKRGQGGPQTMEGGPRIAAGRRGRRDVPVLGMASFQLPDIGYSRVKYPQAAASVSFAHRAGVGRRRFVVEPVVSVPVWRFTPGRESLMVALSSPRPVAAVAAGAHVPHRSAQGGGGDQPSDNLGVGPRGTTRPREALCSPAARKTFMRVLISADP